MIEHYQKFYLQMRKQGDVNGVINALTHLQVLQPSQSKLDTIAYIYMNNNQHAQALSTLGVERNVADSDLAVQVKAVSLKALNQTERAIQQFDILFKRSPSPYLAYELADLKIQIGNIGAEDHINYGLENSTPEMKYAFYERQQPYEVPLKAAFLHLKGLMVFNTDKSRIDESIAFMDQALEIAPNFNLAQLSKEALQQRKEQASKTEGGED